MEEDMKAIFRKLTIAAALAALALSCSNALADGPAAPKIEVTPLDFDFGKIPDDVKSKATYTIKNAGTAELVISDVRPTCGCTVANLTSKKLAPGETSTLEAVFDSRNLSGQVRRFINISSNDPKTSTFAVSLSADIVAKPAPNVELSVYSITNLLLGKGGSADRSVKVISSGQEDLAISEITTSPGVVARFGGETIGASQTRKVDIRLKPKEELPLEVTVAPKVAAGNFQEVVTLRSNSKRRPAVTLILQGVVQ
jgi:hypothetical protein